MIPILHSETKQLDQALLAGDSRARMRAQKVGPRGPCSAMRPCCRSEEGCPGCCTAGLGGSKVLFLSRVKPLGCSASGEELVGAPAARSASQLPLAAELWCAGPQPPSPDPSSSHLPAAPSRTPSALSHILSASQAPLEIPREAEAAGN